jgi:hypothetical protein
MGSTSFPLVRGRTMRVTKLDGCGKPIATGETVAITKGFISVALTANIEEPEAIEVKNADGQTCVRDAGTAEFKGYNVDLTFCNVDPCLFAMLTGQDVVHGYTDGSDDTNVPVIGFTMDSAMKASDSYFALELWARSPGAEGGCVGGVVTAANAEQDPSGYLVLPFLGAGVIGDLTIENAAVNFTISGAVTKDGNLWGKGLYDVLKANTGTKAAPVYEAKKLVDPLTGSTHLGVMYTTQAPPPATDGCVTYAYALANQTVTAPAGP